MTWTDELLNLHAIFKDHPLWKRQSYYPWLRFLHFQVKARARANHTDPLICDWIHPLKLIVEPRSGLTGNIYCGLMEFEEMMFILHILQENDLFVDVGANAGVYSLLASGLANASSIAIEPVPDTFAHLVQHVKINRLSQKIQCIHRGVAQEEGALFFTMSPSACLNHVVSEPSPSSPAVEVPVSTLDRLIESAPKLMKLDVEGYEMFCLQGAARLLEDKNLCAIILEYNQCAARYGVEQAQIRFLLATHGFASVHYDPFARKITPVPMNHNGNSIWIRSAEKVQDRLLAAPHFSIYTQPI